MSKQFLNTKQQLLNRAIPLWSANDGVQINSPQEGARKRACHNSLNSYYHHPDWNVCLHDPLERSQCVWKRFCSLQELLQHGLLLCTVSYYFTLIRKEKNNRYHSFRQLQTQRQTGFLLFCWCNCLTIVLKWQQLQNKEKF